MYVGIVQLYLEIIALKFVSTFLAKISKLKIHSWTSIIMCLGPVGNRLPAILNVIIVIEVLVQACA